MSATRYSFFVLFVVLCIGCSDAATTLPPSPAFTGVPASGRAPLAVSFTDASRTAPPAGHGILAMRRTGIPGYNRAGGPRVAGPRVVQHGCKTGLLRCRGPDRWF